MSIFKELDDLFFSSYLKSLEEKEKFLVFLKESRISVDDGLEFLKEMQEKARKCDIIT